MMKFVSLQHVPPKELTLVWNLCGESLCSLKAKPITYREEHLKAYCIIYKISLSVSVGLLENGRLIGFTLLGIDGDHGWIAFLGILPAFRGKGLSKILLDHQLLICDKIKQQTMSLEVYEHHFMSKVYQTYGFHYSKQLTNYILSPQDLCDLDAHKNSGQCYQEVPEALYFEARNKLKSCFPWRRRDYIIKNYKRIIYYLDLDHASGYVLNSGGILLDIWSLSLSSARSVLSSISGYWGEIVIPNQIHDGLHLYLSEKSIKPVSIQYEMVR